MAAPRRTTRTKTIPTQSDSTVPTSVKPPNEPALVTKRKRAPPKKQTHEADTSDSELPPTTSKKTKVTAANPSAERTTRVAQDTPPQPVARRSNRVVQGQAPIQRRKRRTKAEMEAAREEEAVKKAAAEKTKKRLQEIGEEADRRLEMMDLDDDMSRVALKAGTMRRLSEMAAEQEGEFIAIDVSDSSSDDEHSEDEALKKVSKRVSSLSDL